MPFDGTAKCWLAPGGFTLEERYLIGKDTSTGMSIRTIGKKIGRSASSVSRELRRNADHSTGRYRYDKADSYARARLRCRRRRPQFKPAELALVHSLLRQLWSPEQISGRMALYDCQHKSCRCAQEVREIMFDPES